MYNEEYWKEKKARKELKEGNPDRKNAIQRMKEMVIGFFKLDKEEEDIKHNNHTRTQKERRIRRHRHANRMLNARG